MRDYHIYKIIFECKTTKKVAAFILPFLANGIDSEKMVYLCGVQ